MKVIVTKDYDEMSQIAGKIFKERIQKNKDIVLGLATGSTPKGLYKELIKYYQKGELDFSNVKTFNLDEYVGLSETDKTSYRYFMNNIFFNHVNINKKNIHIPDGKAKNLEKFCLEYDKRIEDCGGIDLQLLGVGEDGHIAFNEPGDYLYTSTHITELAESTIQVNSRFFNSIDEVPKTAITMGMSGIMKSKEIILLADGKKKSEVISKFLNNKKVSTNVPVSFLWMHPNVTVIVDEEAYQGVEK